MQNRKLILAILGVGFYLIAPYFVEYAKGQTPRKVVVHETTLRKKAIKWVIPKYPKDAIKAKASGVAVSEVTISEDGNVINVKILESPHKSIESSIIEALKQWKFHTFTLGGKPQKIVGKITYYFVLENKNAKVESPYKIP